MCSDERTCRQLREYLQSMHVQSQYKTEDDMDDEAETEPSAVFMMRRKLRNYLDWKKKFARVSASLFAENQKVLEGYTSVSDQRGANGYRGKGPPNKRRRVRGGSATAAGGGRPVNGSLQVAEDKESQVASLMADIQPNEIDAQQKEEIAVDDLDDMEDYFELYEMNDLVVIHPYDGDMDEHVLEEVRPRYVIMYEPDAAFIRRVEVYRSSHDDRNVRVYFMYYGGSVEEQRYLSAVRREKDAFTKLIREKGVGYRPFSPDTLLTNFIEYGCDSDPRSNFNRSPRVFPSHGKHSNCGRWSPSSHLGASTNCSRRSRIPLLASFSHSWPLKHCGGVHAHGGRLCFNPAHMRGTQINQGSHLLVQEWPTIQSSRNNAPALQIPHAPYRIRSE